MADSAARDLPFDLPSVPEGWAYVALGDLLEPDGLSYGVVQPGSVDSEGVPVLRVKNVRNGRIFTDEVTRVGADIEAKHKRTRLRGGEVLLTIVGSVGQVAVVPSMLAGWNVARAIGVLRPKREVPSHWIRLCLTTAFAQHCMKSWQNETVQATLNLRDVRRLPIVMPPGATRQAIAEVLGALDDKVAANESCVRVAYQLMRLHFDLAMAQGSVTVAIGDVATVFDGPHATPEKTGSGPWFLSISSLQSGRLVLTESAHLAEHDFARWTRRVTPAAGDVLFSYETRLGEAALMPDGVRACLGRRMALLRPRIDVIGPRTLLQAYLGESFQETIRQRAVHGATVDRIPLTELSAWPITVPERAGRLESLLGAIDDMAAQRERENEALAALRETLLPKLMSGQIRVRDAAKVLEEAL